MNKVDAERLRPKSGRVGVEMRWGGQADVDGSTVLGECCVEVGLLGSPVVVF